MSDSAWKTLPEETAVRYLSLVHEVRALVRSFMSAIRTLQFRPTHRKVGLFGQKVVWRARIINQRVRERKTAVLALQSPPRHIGPPSHQAKCAPLRCAKIREMT
jgi:hypothetical protein